MQDNLERWTALVWSFPTLLRQVACGVRLDSAEDLLAALGVRYDESTEEWTAGPRARWVTVTSLHALLFCLDVWFVGDRSMLPAELRSCSILEVFARWDADHREAALAWFRAPFHPASGLRPIVRPASVA